MSHKANYWLASLDPKRVKAGAFRVLFHLCDHHNDEADPRSACYPSQETLMRKTGLSNGALNNALNGMEEDGLILRRRSTVPGTSERRTYYILGCDGPLPTKQTPEIGDSPNSSQVETATELTPFQGQANSILEPGKLQPTGEEPVRTGNNLAAQPREAATGINEGVRLRGLVLAAMGLTGSELNTSAGFVVAGCAPGEVEMSFTAWRASGLTEGQILSAISSRIEAQRQTQPAFLPRSLRFFDGPVQDFAARLTGKGRPASPSQQSERDRKVAFYRRVAASQTGVQA